MKKTFGAAVGIIVMAALALAIVPTARDEIHWQWAYHKDETAGYKSYLTTWPEGRHAAEAELRYDEHAWAEAKVANTVRSYGAYASAHPKGKFAEEAKTRSSALRTETALFDAAFKTGTEASLKRFLEDFPGHRREREARQALKDIAEGRDIVDVLHEKKIEIKAEGSGIEKVSLRIRRRVPYPLTVRIPVGTFFVSANASAQNMVTTAETKVQLTSDEWASVSPDAACANRPKDIPGSGDAFTVQRSPHQAELAKLMPALERAGLNTETRQAAVWIVTDNADYGDLGILVASQFGIGGSRVINEPEAARAMKVCDEAGIDIRRKAIWKDRERILSGLKDGDLKTWLSQKR